MDSLEIMDTKAQLKQRAYDMIETCKTEIRDFNEEELREFDHIQKEIRNLNNTQKELEMSLRNSDEEINQINNLKKENKMEKRFSLVKAIRSIANNQQMDDVCVAIDNAGREEMRKSGLSMGGQIQLPTQELRAITVTAEGEDIVPTDIYNALEPLRSKNVLVQAGARFLTGLVGDVQVPIMSASNVGWELETGTASNGQGAFTNVKLTPHRLTAYIDISKQLLNQDAIGVENLIRTDIINAVNNKLEATILGDADAGAGPAGMFNGQTPTLANTFATIASLEATVESANIMGECKYIISPSAKADLRPLAKGAVTSQAIYANGEIDGTPAYSTTHISGHNFIYGDFSNLAIGQWGSINDYL